MARLKIVKYPEQVLLSKAKPVKSVKSVDPKVIRDMIDTMYQEDGVGLAAPQVGISEQIIIVSPTAKRGEEKVYFNPRILERDAGEDLGVEGCLSLRGISGEIRRALRVKFEALDAQGKRIVKWLDGFPARVIQHEVDHLNGILIVDRLDFDHRQSALKHYRST